MKFCSKCGLKLDSEISDCPNCRNLSIGTDKQNGIKQTISIKNFNSEKILQEQLMQEKEQINERIEIKNSRLIISKGGTENREFSLSKSICNIGRWDPSLKSHPEVDLSDEDIDAKVSRIHARIVRNSEGFYIEDMGSRNGTFLNREFKLVKGIQYSLKDGDEVIIGHIFFKFKDNQSNNKCNKS